MKPETRGVPWLTVEEAARHLGFKSVGAFHTWMYRAKKDPNVTAPRVHRLGRRIRFRQVDLDKCVEEERDSEPRLRLVQRRG